MLIFHFLGLKRPFDYTFIINESGFLVDLKFDLISAHPKNSKIYLAPRALIRSFTVYMICIGFLVKIPLYMRFHTFLRQFHTFFHTLFEKKIHPICLLIDTNILQKDQTNKINNYRDMLQKGEKSLFFTPISPFLAK